MKNQKWLIPDMYYPSQNVPGPVHGHESISVLNTSAEDAHIKITLYFEDRDPMQLEPYVCPAQRTMHIRMDLAKSIDGKSVPQDTCYASMVESSIGIVVQYSRADARQEALAVMTTICFPVD